MDIRLPNGVLVKNIPDGTSREEVMAKAISSGLATAEDFMGTSSQKSEQEPSNVNVALREPSLPEDTSAVTGRAKERKGPTFSAGQGAINIGAGLLRGAGSIGATALRLFETEEENIARRKAISEGLRNLVGADPESGLFGLGKIAGEVAGTAGLAPVLGAGAAALPVVRALAPAISSSGFVTKVPSGLPAAPATILSRGVDLTKRLSGGAIAGGATAAAIEPTVEDIEIGTAIGAAIPGVAAPVVKGLAKGTGWLWDAISGKLGEVKAAKIARDVAGGDINAIKAANLAASQGETAGQAAAGIDNSAWQALDNLARTSNTGSWWTRRLAVQDAEVTSALNRLAGGTNVTESRAVQESSKKALNAITTPMREEELAKAGIAGKDLPVLEGEYAAYAGAAAANVDDVRRLSDLSQRAEFWAKNWGRGEIGGISTALGLPRTPSRYGYPENLVNLAEQKAVKSAEESLRFGEMARDVQERIKNLSDAGFNPLKTDDLISKLSSKLADPDIATNRDAAGAIKRVNEMLSAWTDRFGNITPEALYAIRKNGVSGAIAELNPGMADNVRKDLAAKVLKDIKPLIDNAIIDAGGSNWGNYLKTFENGMKAIEQKQMADYARNLYVSGDKKGFVDLVKGNNPSAVEDIFGPGRYDFIKEMGGQRPKSSALEFLKLADGVEKDLRVSVLAKMGGKPLADIFAENQSKLLGIPVPPLLSRPITILREGMKEFEGKVNKSTYKALENAMQSGKSANELLAILPTSERSKVLNILSTSEAWNPAVQRALPAAAISSVEE